MSATHPFLPRARVALSVQTLISFVFGVHSRTHLEHIFLSEPRHRRLQLVVTFGQKPLRPGCGDGTYKASGSGVPCLERKKRKEKKPQLNIQA